MHLFHRLLLKAESSEGAVSHYTTGKGQGQGQNSHRALVGSAFCDQTLRQREKLCALSYSWKKESGTFPGPLHEPEFLPGRMAQVHIPLHFRLDDSIL